jgi:hypothetical protein
MKATDSKLPIATGRIPDKGASLYVNIFIASITRVPIIVNVKCRKDRNTMKLKPSISVIYLLQMTIPTTDRIFPTTPVATTTEFDTCDEDVITGKNVRFVDFGRKIE